MLTLFHALMPFILTLIRRMLVDGPLKLMARSQ